MLPALGHVPLAHVTASYEPVTEEITDVIERTVRRMCRQKIDELAV